MNWPKFEEMNSDRFLEAAFDPERNGALIRHAKTRRDVYLILFLVGVVCVFVTALAERASLCVPSLFLGTLSLVVMTKYDTRLYFLRVLRKRGEEPLEIDHAR